MRMPGFWGAGGSRGAALLLRPLGWIYGALTLLRLRRSGWRAPVPVISVGNFTAGGAGKTPTVIALVRALQARGERPFVITRGYGGSEAGPLRVDPALHDAVAVGDEARLLALHAPTIVARDRADGARLACASGAGVILLDDALQNPALEKDFSLAVIDAGFGFGNGECVPAGPLRAPVEAMLEHVSAALMIGEGGTDAGGRLGSLPVFHGVLEADAAIAARLSGQKIIAYCGIGRPEKFFATLRRTGARISETAAYPDHHILSAREAAALLEAAGRSGAQLVTTEKDLARITGLAGLEALAQASIALPVSLRPDPALLGVLYRALDSARSRASTADGPA